MPALHPVHRHNKGRKILLDLVLKQGAIGENNTHQYAGEPFVVVFHGDLDLDTLVHELFKALDREEAE
jgi:hypothetical protein